jgi:3-oxoadipate enol-lactonase
MDDLVEDAARVIREWGRGPVVWIGLSMGGMVGQGLAIRHPELIKALVVANSTSYYPDAGREMWRQRIATVQEHGIAAIADAVMGRYFHDGYRRAQPQAESAALAGLLRNDQTGYLGCCHAVAEVDWRAGLPGITCPTLVIAGELDQGAPVAMSQAIADAIPGARLEVLPEASHISVLEQPAAFEAVIRTFLAGLDG